MLDDKLKKRCLVRIVDDDEAVRNGLGFLLSCADWSYVAYGTAEDFLNEDNFLIPGCLLLDLRMPGMNGLQLQQCLIEKGVGLPIVIITGHGDMDTAIRSLKKGALDFLVKPVSAEKLEAVLEEVISKSLTGANTKDAYSIYVALSDREKEILNLVVKDLTSKQIGERLGLSEGTVQGHRLNISKKFNAHSKAELAAWFDRVKSID